MSHDDGDHGVTVSVSVGAGHSRLVSLASVTDEDSELRQVIFYNIYF